MLNVAASNLTLRISRRFDSPPERVFDAWIGKEWGAWLPPAGARCEITKMDPKVGGTFNLDMTMSDGKVMHISGTYVEITRPSRLIFTWHVSDPAHDTTIDVLFKRDNQGTVMTLTQEGFPNTDLYAGYHNGWTRENGSFEKLATILAAA